ncbi:cupin 2 domain-containing protein [Desulfonispora thiosulfatigenes DSM 11270]|uniref:Cupin 2 domain-containing protein n=1 Tax=Desulfonispora thiosulfatigenes DSM 11270 TaxID=656914 RepID=A0A1W1UYJ3_DESTI|nr:cupin domain-containing protein [Desulfonispora thiosulfatigenes]SMB85804.1 cupin 2 domain-containing protein [Desulfonispora thiosulfatigenes DSM 11270]
MNIYDLPQLPLTEELVTNLLKNKNVRVERIISAGQTTDWYDQDETEFVILLQGNASLEFENKEVSLKQGETILINAHEKHRVSYTSSEPPCIWLCIFTK